MSNLKLVKEFNDKTIRNLTINKDTIIAYDLHGVIANYDVKKMFSIFIRNLWCLESIFYPKIFSISFSHIKKREAGPQEILDKIKKIYPDNNKIEKFISLGIDMAAQLTPIEGTIKIIKALVDNGYKVVIMSNIETKLWQRFIKDFPFFKNFEYFISTPENNFLKKPNIEYFKKAIEKFDPKKNENGQYNIVFIDDRLKSAIVAKKCGIPSYVFIDPENLKSALVKMNANLSQK